MALKKVMLIDDNETDLFINKKCIQLGAEVESIICKQSGVSALEYLITAADETIPDLILLDVRMPEMDGFSFLEKFCMMKSTSNGRTKVVMVSSSDSKEDKQKALTYEKFGVVHYIEKPLSEEKVNFLKDALLL